MTARRTISLDDSTDTALTDLAGDVPISHYLAGLITRRLQEVRDAWEVLMVAEWSAMETRAAVAALNGTWLTGHQAGPAIALELHDAARLDKDGPRGGYLARWGIPAERWQDRVSQVRARDDVARALVTLAAEWWAGVGEGALVERLISRLTPPA